jgi:hypothetical protein
MKFARIHLDQTNYSYLKDDQWSWIPSPDPSMIRTLDDIYVQYCRYKKFSSFMPIFSTEYTDKMMYILGYHDQGELVAFSLIKRHTREDVEAVQFAWNYENPKLHLGIKSLRHECAIFKGLGFKYLWLGEANEYKKKIDGFEVMGPV